MFHQKRIIPPSPEGLNTLTRNDYTAWGTILKVSFMKTIQVELPDRLAEPLHEMVRAFVLPSILATAPLRLVEPAQVAVLSA